MCGIIGYVGPRECKPLLLHGLERLEYRGYDSAGIALLEDGGLAYTRAVGNLQNLKERVRHERLGRDDRARPHALGDARRRDRGERASARSRGRREARDRPQRDRRELPRAARAPLRARPRLLVRDRRRDRHAPDRGALRRRSRRGRAPRVRGARGALRLRRDPPRPPGHARRRPAAVPDGRRPRRGRGLPRLERRRVPQRDARRPVPGRRRDRRHHRGGLPVPPRRGRRRRSSTRSSSSTGTSRAPRRPATRRSC